MVLKYPEEKYEKWADNIIERVDAFEKITQKYKNDVRPQVRELRDMLFNRFVAYQDILNKCRFMQDDIVAQLKQIEEEWGEPQNE